MRARARAVSVVLVALQSACSGSVVSTGASRHSGGAPGAGGARSGAATDSGTVIDAAIAPAPDATGSGGDGQEAGPWSCTNDCAATVTEAFGVRCVPVDGTELGAVPGVCDYGNCAVNYWDLDGKREDGCEYYCDTNPDRLSFPDLGGPSGCGVDDDCNGLVDDGIDFCHDRDNCGSCGNACSKLLHVVDASCVTIAQGGPCDSGNTQCAIGACAANWSDADGVPANGCEHWTGPPAAPAPEICDGVDNDLDGAVDETGPQPDGIDGSADPANPSVHIGEACGSDVGRCKAGRWACVNGAVACVGQTGPVRDACDGIDNDCDGTVDDDPPSGPTVCGTGKVCAMLAPNFYGCLGPCHAGDFACPAGQACRPLTISGTTQTYRLCVPVP